MTFLIYSILCGVGFIFLFKKFLRSVDHMNAMLSAKAKITTRAFEPPSAIAFMLLVILAKPGCNLLWA